MKKPATSFSFFDPKKKYIIALLLRTEKNIFLSCHLFIIIGEKVWNNTSTIYKNKNKIL